MMKNADIFIAKEDHDYKVRVVGRATFAVGPTLRNFVTRIQNDSNIKSVSINMGKCTGMDSTFMGILAMLALKVKKYNCDMLIVNANESNQKLLYGLGLNKLFEFTGQKDEDLQYQQKEEIKTVSFQENAETVLEAHKTLMESDKNNVDKFKNVVEQVEKELKK